MFPYILGQPQEFLYNITHQSQHVATVPHLGPKHEGCRQLHLLQHHLRCLPCMLAWVRIECIQPERHLRNQASNPLMALEYRLTLRLSHLAALPTFIPIPYGSLYSW